MQCVLPPFVLRPLVVDHGTCYFVAVRCGEQLSKNNRR